MMDNVIPIAASAFRDATQKKGALSAYLIDPDWAGPFPYRLPREQWPLLDTLFVKQNLITSDGRVYSYAHGFNFAYFAGGTGTTAPSASNKTLQSEVQRFAVTDVIYSVGQIDAYTEIAPDTGNLTWQEWGLIMGDGTATLNSGTLYNRLLQEYIKSYGDTILLQYTLTEAIS